MGHALVDLVGAGIVALLLLAAERFRLTPHAIVWDNMWLGILCGWAVMFFVATLIERAFVVTRKHETTQGHGSRQSWSQPWQFPQVSPASISLHFLGKRGQFWSSARM